MTAKYNFCVLYSAPLVVLALVATFVLVDAKAESTRTVELDIRPGGVVHTFAERIVSDRIYVFPFFCD